ncbi:MAG TPA: glycosyltransferase family 4 protein [Vicinamibacterales bacterium]|nr:glycosyltransferase family 4 protein [Vicinamibacterales bacterium]
MTPLRILILEAQVPFVHGGAEILVRELAAALTARGHRAQIVSVPFTDAPRDELLAGVEAWRLLDVTRAAGGDVDLVIATKFPTYFASHPRKVLWLVHQHRAAYELAGTRFSDFAHTPRDVALRRRLIDLDTRALRECVGHFTIARTVSDRMLKFNGIASAALYNPPKLAGRLHAGPCGDYVLTVTRLEHVKRVDLTIDTFEKTTSSVRLLIAGDGSIRHELSEYIERRGLRERVTLLGRVDDERLIELYAGCRAVLFAPYEEDYGYVTLEAFLARKPVITACDSGGTLEFVTDGVNGYVCEPTPDALAAAVNRLAADPALAASLGERGHGVAAPITWDHVVDRLLAAQGVAA